MTTKPTECIYCKTGSCLKHDKPTEQKPISTRHENGPTELRLPEKMFKDKFHWCAECCMIELNETDHVFAAPVDIIELLSQALHDQKETFKQQVMGMRKEDPKPIRKEIWSERGITTIVSPDVFAQEYVNGFNRCLDQVLAKLEKLG